MGKKIHIMPPEGRTAGLWEQPAPFQLPHSVELAFVRSMECPWCHSNLLMDRPLPKSPETVYCPVCGWKPRDAHKEAKEATTTRTKLLELKRQMDEVLPEKGTRHDLGNGYHIYFPETYYDVAREGTLMENCTADEGCHELQRDVNEGRQPPQWSYDKPYNTDEENGWSPAYLRDDEGIPHAMWTHQFTYRGEPYNDNQASDAEGRRGQPLKPEYIQMLRQYYDPEGSPEDWHERFAKTAAGYSDDFRTLVGMMKHAYEQENYSEIYQLSQRMAILADEMIPQAHEENVFGNDSVPGHDQLVTWMYGQGQHEGGNDLIDKHVALQSNQFSLPGRIKQYAGFIDRDITEGNLTGFKREMMPQYVQAALAQFHEGGKWQGAWQILKNEGGAWEDAMNDPEKAPGVIDSLFELEMSKSDPIYQKLQKAVHSADAVGRTIQWIQQTLDEGDQKHQDYHEVRQPYQEQYDQHQQQLQEFHDKWNTPGDSLEDVARELGIDLNSKTAAGPYWYHVAPTTERARIQTHGLIPAHPGIHPQWSDQATDVAWQPEGVYVSPNEDMAKYYQQHYYTGQPTDIWRIPVEQVQEYYPDPLGEYYIKHPVQPELHLPYEESLDKWGKTSAHVDVNVRTLNEEQVYGEGYFGGSVGIEALTPEGQKVGILIVDPQERVIDVPHAEVDPKYRDTDVFMQLAIGLVKWMRATNNIKPISMQTIYPGIKSLVDRWNSRFDQLPEEQYADLYDPKDVVPPGREDMSWFYSKEAADFDTPPLENPVSYQWVPWTDQELGQWDLQDDITKAAWKRKSRNLTRGARRRGYGGTVTGRDLWLLNNRYQGKCAYCGQPGADSWDHVKPLSQGGEHTPSNILPAHLQCNYELGQWDDRNRDYRIPRTKEDWTMQPAEARWKFATPQIKVVPDGDYFAYDTGEIEHDGGGGNVTAQAWDNNELVGSMWAEVQDQDADPRIWVWQAYVKPEYRDTGLMQDLARALKAEYPGLPIAGYRSKQRRDVMVARLGGFRVWSDKIHDLAERNREQGKQQLREWRGPSGGEGIARWQMGWALLQQMPDQGYKLMPWVTREIIKNDLLDRQGFAHVQDIVHQATKWFDWCREHNKPLPEFNRKDFGFDQLEAWVYEMNAQEGKADEWQDSTPVYTWEDGWHIDRVGEQDLAREGELMGHCVGGYCTEVRHGDSSIFSLRDPKGMPHVTLEVEGNFGGTEENPNMRSDLRVIQVQGKQDTEPIPEYRDRIDRWFEHLGTLGWQVNEEDPEREPEMEYVEHPEGPQHFNEPEDYLDYHKIMHDQYDRLYNFGEDEDPEIQGNVWTYYDPRALHKADTPQTLANQAYDFIKKWEAGQYDNEEAVKMVQAMWLSIHHSTEYSQQYHNNWQGWDQDELRKQANQFWDQAFDYLKAMLETAHPKKPIPGAPQLFDPKEYEQAQISPQGEAFLGLMYKLSMAPHEWEEPQTKIKQNEEGKNIYRNTETGETGDLYAIGYPNEAVREPRFNEDGSPMMQTKRLDFPGSGGGGYWTDYGDYFNRHGLDQFPAPVTSSWVPLEAHQSAPNGLRVQAWTLTSEWQNDPDKADWQHGMCDTYALAMHEMYPHLQIGGVVDPAVHEYPYHWFAHDDQYAYDSLGRHQLPYPTNYPGVKHLLNIDTEDYIDSAGYPYGENGSKEDYERAKQLILQQHPYLRTAKLAWKKIEPHEELRNIAHGYMANQGWGDYDPPQTFPDVDPERARRIAEEYEKMQHAPNDPNVKASYEALMRETQAQYEHLLQNGYQMEFEPEGGAYASPWDAISDVRDNKHLYVYPTSAGFGTEDSPDHPLLQNTGYEWNGQPVTYNDLFRGVHDVFGHAKEGVGFRSDGEENAWRQHAAMFSDPARQALTSETRGQNSWVNYGPHGEQNQNADQSGTVYAPQKAGLMPDWTAYEGSHDE